MALVRPEKKPSASSLADVDARYQECLVIIRNGNAPPGLVEYVALFQPGWKLPKVLLFPNVYIKLVWLMIVVNGRKKSGSRVYNQ